MAVSVAVCKIFTIKEWCDLENRVRVRSRSLEMTPFDRSHTTSYSPFIVTGAILYRLRDIATLLVENHKIFIGLPHLYLSPPPPRRKWPRRNFVKMFVADKTRIIGLPLRPPTTLSSFPGHHSPHMSVQQSHHMLWWWHYANFKFQDTCLNFYLSVCLSIYLSIFTCSQDISLQFIIMYNESRTINKAQITGINSCPLYLSTYRYS